MANESGLRPDRYTEAGVSIDAGARAVDLMRDAVRATYDERVLGGIGYFGGVFDAAALKQMARPALVSSTDGVGTKTMLAAALGRYASIGQDIVNHCINDILVQGARPLFFLDYIASSRLEPERVAALVSGMAEACRAAGCALIGGETAEMPGVYRPEEFDVAGTIVGVVERDEMWPQPDVQAGDVLLGLPSSGPHTNGYSLIRHVFADVPLTAEFEGIGMLGDALLAPHRSYLPAIDGLRRRVRIKALAHITGGGLVDNLPRVLPAGTAARIRLGAWPIPPLFTLIQDRGQVSHEEMFRVFNMGIGMVIILAPDQARLALDGEEQLYRIGELTSGDGRVYVR